MVKSSEDSSMKLYLCKWMNIPVLLFENFLYWSKSFRLIKNNLKSLIFIQFQLTPEEIRVLKECGREGVIARAIPMGMVGAIIGYMGSKSGPLMSTKFGYKPAVIGLGLVGYFMGRFSYSKVCFDRALQVPNGTLRKFYSQRNTSR